EYTSRPIRLVAHQTYWVHGLYKESGGGDYLQVAWRKESDTTRAGDLTPIAGTYLMTYMDPMSGPPVISQQPQNQFVQLGGTATFTVEIDRGALPMSYQWRKGLDDLTGATNHTLSIVGVDVSSIGTYNVVVSNPDGIATTDSALLLLKNA